MVISSSDRPYIYDLVIIGGGIAGLRCATGYLQALPKSSVLVLEATSYWGGRMKVSKFAGAHVQLGAGIGRAYKDERLKKLVSEKGIKTMNFPKCVRYGPRVEDQVSVIQRTLGKLSDAANGLSASDRSRMTFREFAIGVLSEKYYAEFVKSLGYTDFEGSDVIDAIHDYGFDDTFVDPREPRELIAVPWSQLISVLVQDLSEKGAIMRINSRVDSISKSNSKFNINLATSENITASNVVIATTAPIAASLIPDANARKRLQSGVRAQPFLRIYVQFSELQHQEIASRVECMTVVDNDLQKIFPVDPVRRIYSIAYADNAHAENLVRGLPKDAKKRRAFLAGLVRDALGLPGIPEIVKDKIVFWPHGTHYFTPLPKKYGGDRDEYIREIQAPNECPGLFLAGEAFSRQQGWVEGALMSADKVIELLTASRVAL